MCSSDLADVAAEFEAAIVDVLVAKSIAALEQGGLTRLIVAGGVGANARLRAQLNAAADRAGHAVFYPRAEFCTDNGAMIAWAGLERLRLGRTDGLDFRPRPRWPLEPTAAVRV